MDAINRGNDMNHSAYRDHVSLETHTVLLCIFAYAVSTIFGGVANIAVTVTIISSRHLLKWSYAPMLTLLLNCLFINFLWSPLEMADLLLFYQFQQHLDHMFLAYKTFLYYFLILVNCHIIFMFTLEDGIRRKYCSGRRLTKGWGIFSLGAILSAAFIAQCLVNVWLLPDEAITQPYIIMDENARINLLFLSGYLFFTMWFAILYVFLPWLVNSVQCHNGRPRFKRQKTSLEIPEFLISQSNACADNDGGFEPSYNGGSPSPSTPTIQAAVDQEAQVKGEDANHISELPRSVGKPLSDRLGINIAQVLGRRRHTICQITDSSSSSSTTPAVNSSVPMDPITRAKQYSYVRKFSVDIPALQAQLQNPKIFTGAPYQSDIDISKKISPNSWARAPQPAQSPTSLPGNLDEECIPDADKTLDTAHTTPSPPEILVSDEDEVAIALENHVLNNRTGSFRDNTTKNVTGRLQKRNSDLSESLEEHVPPSRPQSAASPHSEVSQCRTLMRLKLQLCLMFAFSVIFLFVVDTLRGVITSHVYTNLLTFAVSISSIQTIGFPCVLVSCDKAVHGAVQRLRMRLKNACVGDSSSGVAGVHGRSENSYGSDHV